MARPIRLWSGTRPTGTELEDRIRRELRIVRADGYRAVQDSYGHRVRVELDRVRDHVAMSADRSRWRFIPLIVETIKRGYRTQRGAGFQYEARVTISHRERGNYERASFVVGTRSRAGYDVFSSIVSPSKEGDVRRRERKAGIVRNPRLVKRPYMGTPDPEPQDRAARRLRGAAPALEDEDTTVGRASERRGLLLVLGLVGLAIARDVRKVAAA